LEEIKHTLENILSGACFIADLGIIFSPILEKMIKCGENYLFFSSRSLVVLSANLASMMTKKVQSYFLY